MNKCNRRPLFENKFLERIMKKNCKKQIKQKLGYKK